MKKEPTIQTIAELQAISTLFLDDKIVFYLEATGNWYFWDKSSTLTEDGIFIIKPNDVASSGRFVALSGSVRRGTSEEDVPSSAAPPLTKIWWVNPLISGGKAVWLAVSTAANGWMRVNSLTNP